MSTLLSDKVNDVLAEVSANPEDFRVRPNKYYSSVLRGEDLSGVVIDELPDGIEAFFDDLGVMVHIHITKEALDDFVEFGA